MLAGDTSAPIVTPHIPTLSSSSSSSSVSSGSPSRSSHAPAPSASPSTSSSAQQQQQQQKFVGFARIFSGVLTPESTVYIFGPRHDAHAAQTQAQNDEQALHLTAVRGFQLCLLMGREMEPLSRVPAGNIFGISGVDEHVLSSATLSTVPTCIPFSDMRGQSFPILTGKAADS